MLKRIARIALVFEFVILNHIDIPTWTLLELPNWIEGRTYNIRLEFPIIVLVLLFGHITVQCPTLYASVCTCSNEGVLLSLIINPRCQANQWSHSTLAFKGWFQIDVQILGTTQPTVFSQSLRRCQRVFQIWYQIHLITLIQEVIMALRGQIVVVIYELFWLQNWLQSRSLYYWMFLVWTIQEECGIQILVLLIQIPKSHFIVIRLISNAYQLWTVTAHSIKLRHSIHVSQTEYWQCLIIMIQ